jgi:aminopeptidase N
MTYRMLCIGLLSCALAACHSTKETVTSVKTVEATAPKPQKPEAKKYQASNTITHKLTDIKIDVSFDWEKKWMYGKATLTLVPNFYASKHVDLNARGMQINEVAVVKKGIKVPLKYLYENDSLKIDLDTIYNRTQAYLVYIDYIAKPDELKTEGGSAAISSDKGLYFINADGKDLNKPRQIWTQGETQSNQVWMPIIDSPNQRMTQEISMTVDTNFKTLSNGLMISSKNLGNGLRTDVWKQSLPAAPYLTMMAVGNYAIIKDKYKNMEVNYYVYPEYANDATAIFGNTPEMLKYFSELLVPYPWEKYSQVIAEDYVSGAMENTTATVHGSFVQQHKRELIDGNQDDIIAHELFHQWFGDLVTTESWSNLTLNESFATYGEYLWQDYKYGRDAADRGLQADLNTYMAQAKQSDANLVRFEYEAREEMFDGISYQKGGRILHMLRKYVGDEAFFESLRDFLNTNKFTAAEAHQLRLSFEKITGEDLNWFWNQWYFSKGYPILNIEYSYNTETQTAIVVVNQKTSEEQLNYFKLPVDIDFYVNGKATRKRFTITSETDTFKFSALTQPELINFDAEKMLLCKKTDNHSKAEWLYMLQHAPLYLDKFEALTKIGMAKPGTAEATTMLTKATTDPYHGIRVKATNGLKEIASTPETEATIKSLLMQAMSDKKSAVRSNAIEKLGSWFADEDFTEIYKKTITTDSSYMVIGSALKALTEKNASEGLAVAESLESQNDENINTIIAKTYGSQGKAKHADFMSSYLIKSKGFETFGAINNMATYLKNQNETTIEECVPAFEEIARSKRSWFIKLQATNQLSSLATTLELKAKDAVKELEQAKTNNAVATDIAVLEKKLAGLHATELKIKAKVEDIKRTETDEKLKKLYNGKADVEINVND